MIRLIKRVSVTVVDATLNLLFLRLRLQPTDLFSLNRG